MAEKWEICTAPDHSEHLETVDSSFAESTYLASNPRVTRHSGYSRRCKTKQKTRKKCATCSGAVQKISPSPQGMSKSALNSTADPHPVASLSNGSIGKTQCFSPSQERPKRLPLGTPIRRPSPKRPRTQGAKTGNSYTMNLDSSLRSE